MLILLLVFWSRWGKGNPLAVGSCKPILDKDCLLDAVVSLFGAKKIQLEKPCAIKPMMDIALAKDGGSYTYRTTEASTISMRTWFLARSVVLSCWIQAGLSLTHTLCYCM